jgi:hypothetical protein
MAEPLSILISDPNGCLTFQIFGLTVVSGQALQKPGMKSCRVALLVAVRFAAPIVSLSQGPFKKGEASPFAAGFAGNIGPRINSPDTGF